MASVCEPPTTPSKDLSEDLEATNWVSAHFALEKLRDALVKPTERAMKGFFEKKIRPVEACTLNCKTEHIKGTKGIVTKCKTCDRRMKIIMGHALTHDGKKSQITWSNTVLGKWSKDYWEVAKCYLGSGQRDSCGPDTTDCANILTLWLNCSIFISLVKDTTLLEKVREHRNRLVHSPAMKLSDEEMALLFESIADLVSDEILSVDTDLDRQAVIQALERKDGTLERLRWELAITYPSLHDKLQPVPWSNKTLPINLVYQEQTLSGSHDSSSELKAIFEPTAGGQPMPKRTLIEGGPGMGKTTLCQRLMQAWARGVKAPESVTQSTSRETPSGPQDELEGSDLHSFQLVFFLQVREMIQGNLAENLLQNLVKDCWRDKEILIRCIGKYTDQVLFVIDGYDEGDDRQQSLTDEWLRGPEMRGCTVIVTSRPGFCNPTPPPDRSYTLQGFDKSKQQEFILGFDKVMGTVSGEKPASQLLSPLQGQCFLQIPLLLALVCLMAREGQSELPQTITGLYKQFVSFMSAKALRDPINFKKGYVSKLLNLLQKIAFQLLTLKKFEITSDMLNQHVSESNIEGTMKDLCKLGLVCQKIEAQGLPNDQSGTFIHRSFLDYFSACHFVTLSNEDQSTYLENTAIHETMFLFVAGLYKNGWESDCFSKMLSVWTREVEAQPYPGHSLYHASLLWLSELMDPAWLSADHVATINQTNRRIRLSCTPFCMRGVTTLIQTAEHHGVLSCPLRLGLGPCPQIDAAAQLDVLQLALRTNVTVECESINMRGLTRVTCSRLADLLPDLPDLKHLIIAISSWDCMDIVPRGFLAKSQLRELTVTCDPPSTRDSPPGVPADWTPRELIEYTSRLGNTLWRMELKDGEDTLTTENKSEIRRLMKEKLPFVAVFFYDKNSNLW